MGRFLPLKLCQKIWSAACRDSVIDLNFIGIKTFQSDIPLLAVFLHEPVSDVNNNFQ
jgi:hypothetical protein